MDAEIKRKWVEALRSGEYKQGKMQLYHARRKEYCCLGVLCVAVGKSFQYGLLPTKIEENCIAMNDKHHWSFTEIADYIEGHL